MGCLQICLFVSKEVVSSLLSLFSVKFTCFKVPPRPYRFSRSFSALVLFFSHTLKLSSSSPMAQRRRTRRPRRTQYSRPPVQSSDPQPSMDHAADDNPSNTPAVELESVDISNNGFSTPKAQRFRIPEILTCPPAPKKRRPNYSLRRSPIAFFAPPDLELFFFFALGDVSPFFLFLGWILTPGVWRVHNVIGGFELVWVWLLACVFQVKFEEVKKAHRLLFCVSPLLSFLFFFWILPL
ncbi:hypothetical protein PVL29_007218 [Vitis rotundifolia]|uniref:Uncharacterized protein n=1 Tax=Vitis rotundifolia TaxID=103349 RepID=A0AA39DUG3_VITRO|nr:hypothetical protein PVL29_007218 [Vitis rotundifolia]